MLPTDRELIIYQSNATISISLLPLFSYCFAHSIFLFHCKCVSSVYIEGFNTGRGGAHLRDDRWWRLEAKVAGGRLRRRRGPRGGHHPSVGAAMWHGVVRSGHFLVGAPCSPVALRWRRRWRGHDGCVEEVLARGRRWRWGPDGGSVRSSHFLDGSLAVAACEGNENWEVI
jgi:hypothetical protein